MKISVKNKLLSISLMASLMVSISGCDGYIENTKQEVPIESDTETTALVSEENCMIDALGDSIEAFSINQKSSTPTPTLTFTPTPNPTQTPTPTVTPVPTATPTPIPPKPSENITGLSFVTDEDISLTVDGPTYSGGIVILAISIKDYAVSDIVFKFDDPEIAQVTTTQKSSANKMMFTIRALAEGETYVHAETSDGLVSSERRLITVGSLVEVESVWIEEECTLELGDSRDLEYEVSPSDASYPNLTWKSSNTSVVTVDSNGHITGVRIGEAEITATASNGVSATCEVSVKQTRMEMNLKIKRSGNQGEYIGGEWHHNVKIDGESVKNGKYTVSAGETLEIYCRSEESDSVPDVGDETVYYTVTEEDIAEGFEVEVVVEIEENRGRNAGNVAVFTTTLVFTP